MTLVAGNCCFMKSVNWSDSRGGIYIFKTRGNRTTFPDVCDDECVYTKQNDYTGQLYCFGRGDLTSQCSGTSVVLIGGGPQFHRSETLKCGNLTNFDDLDIQDIGTAFFQNSIYACGGYSRNGASNKCYKSSNGVWNNDVMPMNIVRTDFTLNTVGKYLVAAGGTDYTGNAKSETTVEVFNGIEWKLMNLTLKVPRYGHCAVTISETKIVLIGGDTRVEKIDVEFLETEIIEEMEIPIFYPSCALFDGGIFIAGGQTNDALDSVKVLDLNSYTWRSVQSLIHKRSDAFMLVVNNRLTIYGGWNNELDRASTLSSSEEYVKETGWKVFPLAFPHVFHTAVVMPCN